jgi:hypothetical protein
MPDRDVTALAAVVFAVVALGVIAFQMALALGAPWGSYAMGGAFPGRFPPRLRVAAVVQAAVLVFAVAIVLARAGIALPALSDAARLLIWLVVGFSVLSLVLNAFSPNAGERRIWTPVALVMLITSAAVALTAA